MQAKSYESALTRVAQPRHERHDMDAVLYGRRRGHMEMGGTNTGSYQSRHQETSTMQVHAVEAVACLGVGCECARQPWSPAESPRAGGCSRLRELILVALSGRFL